MIPAPIRSVWCSSSSSMLSFSFTSQISARTAWRGGRSNPMREKRRQFHLTGSARTDPMWPFAKGYAILGPFNCLVITRNLGGSGCD